MSMCKTCLSLPLMFLLSIGFICGCAKGSVGSDLDFKKICYDLSWRAHASCYVNDGDTNNWYRKDKYKQSIYVEISKAIVDCKLKRGVFNTKKDIIEFEGTDPAKYSNANWNAVVLYNFINCKFNNKDFNNVRNTLQGMYGDKINKAISDIKQYSDALKLSEYNIQEVKDNEYIIKDACFGETKCGLKVKRENDKTKIILNNLWEREVELTPDMKISKYNTLKVNPLPNFMEGYPITNNKCWFNSVMINLYNSEVFQKVINELASKAKNKSASQSYWIKQIFNNIKTGDMKNYVENLNGLVEAMESIKKGLGTLSEKIKGGKPLCVENFYQIMLQLLDSEYNSFYNKDNPNIVTYNCMVCSSKCVEKYSCIEEYKKYSVECSGFLNLCDAYNALGGKQIVDETTYVLDEKRLPRLIVFNTIADSNPSSGIIDITSFKKRNKKQYPEYIQLSYKNVLHKYRLIGFTEQHEHIDEHSIARIKLEDGTWRYINDYGCDKGVTKCKFDEMSKYRTLAFYEKQN